MSIGMTGRSETMSVQFSEAPEAVEVRRFEKAAVVAAADFAVGSQYIVAAVGMLGSSAADFEVASQYTVVAEDLRSRWFGDQMHWAAAAPAGGSRIELDRTAAGLSGYYFLRPGMSSSWKTCCPQLAEKREVQILISEADEA